MSEKNENVDEQLIIQLMRNYKDQADFQFSDNRRNRAELRRYWSPGTRSLALKHLALLGGFRNGVVLANGVLAALFAEHPEHRLEGLRFGQAALKLAGGGPKASEFESFERHFRRLLACDSSDLDDVGLQIYRIVKRMSKAKPPIVFDYNSLLWDLRRWKKESDSVKIGWATDFWAPYSSKTEATVE